MAKSMRCFPIAETMSAREFGIFTVIWTKYLMRVAMLKSLPILEPGADRESRRWQVTIGQIVPLAMMRGCVRQFR